VKLTPTPSFLLSWRLRSKAANLKGTGHDPVVAACGDSPIPVSRRNDRYDESEADRLIREHGIRDELVIPLTSLARSRGVPLELVLRAWMRGDLRDVVRMSTPVETH
jgi:hypothetical protein